MDNSLTPEEVAAILRIKKNTVYEMIKRGDLQAYRIGRKYRIERSAVEAYKFQAHNQARTAVAVSGSNAGLELRLENLPAAEAGKYEWPEALAGRLVIYGLDIMLDVLGKYLEKLSGNLKVYRKNAGSFDGLNALYHGEADMAGIHLWDSDSDTYNVPYVRRLLPGTPAVIVHLAKRWQGFYVRSGNPLNIKDWPDITRSDLQFVNREPGCGARVLLDEKIRALGLDRYQINGYSRIEMSHLAVASAVARGTADVGLGIQKAALQVRDVEFIPLQKESYELVVLGDAQHASCLERVLEILNSEAFKEEITGLGDYDLSGLGRITVRF